jgi:hypothetical protein
MAHMKQSRAATIAPGIEAMKAPTFPTKVIVIVISKKKNVKTI